MSDQSEQRLFCYEPITDPRGIRLLRISRDGSTEGSYYSFEPASLDHPPPYTTVSYTWGDQTPVDLLHFSDETVLPLSQALPSITNQFQLQLEDGNDDECLIWIDALCIDQNNTEEKEQQVRRMKDIYGAASQTIVWLGEEDTDTEEGFQLLPALGNMFELIEKGDQSVLEELKTICNVDEANSPLSQVSRLIDRPYFSRVWVIQEVALGKKVFVAWGQYQLPWKTLAYIQSRANRYGVSIKRTKYPYSSAGLSAIQACRSTFQQDQVISFNRLILVSAFFMATDPRDKVYALLGLLPPEDAKGITVDYRQSAEEVFMKTSYYILTQKPLLEGLITLADAGIGLGGDRRSLPSWAPDWLSVSRLTHFSKSQYADTPDPTSQPVARYGPHSGSLTIEGIVVDTVTKISSRRPTSHAVFYPADRDALAKQCQVVLDYLEEARHGFQYTMYDCDTKDQWPLDAFWRTLIADIDFSSKNAEVAAPELKHAFVQWLQRLKSAAAGDDSWIKQGHSYPENRIADTGAFRDAFSRYYGCRLFATAGGYFGLGLPGIKEDDRVIWIKGGRIPYIIRQSSASDHGAQGTYQLVGRCFVYGLTEDKAVELGEVQDIVLV